MASESRCAAELSAPGRADLPSGTAERDPVGQRPDVLVVDDDDDQLQLLSTYLSRAGCTVTAVATGEEALATIEHFEPGLAIIDLLLPGVSGDAVARELRRRWPACRIALTSVLDAADYPRADASLPKPFTRKQVLDLLADVAPTDRA